MLYNGGYVQPNCYYPDPSYLPQHATPPPPHFDIDAFLSTPSAYQPLSPSSAATCPSSSSPSSCQMQSQFQHHGSQPNLLAPQYNHGAASGCYPTHQHSPSSYHHGYGACSCGCPPYKPVQETFLHKILTGKGYKNDAMCVNHQAHLAAGRSLGSMDNIHCSYGASHGIGGDFSMASSCCYANSSLPPMPMSAAIFPSSGIPGF